MTIGAIIQARMGSNRLPGKVLKSIGDKPMLLHVVERVARCSQIDKVIIATTTLDRDNSIVNFCTKHSLSFFRGKEDDVLSRYFNTAVDNGIDIIVRITSDCPMIDPSVIQTCIDKYMYGSYDYVSNRLNKYTYPRGLDTEIFSKEGLKVCNDKAKACYQRSHVTPYFYENPNIFALGEVEYQEDFSQYRLTVDTPEDLKLVRKVYEHFDDNKYNWQEVIEVLKNNPQISEINSKIEQKDLKEG